MKNTLCLILVICAIHTVSGQFFVQQLSQMEIRNAQSTYIVTNEGDTLRGTIISANYIDSTITRFTLKITDEKRKFDVSEIASLAVIPDQMANYEDFALKPVLKNLKNEEFISVLPEDGWVIYERVRLPVKQERYILTQLLNPGFDQKIKVYKDPQASSTGSSSLNGLTLGGNLDDSYLVAVNDDRPFRISNFRYRKLAPEKLYRDCKKLTSQKLKWKEFAQHVFTYDQGCN